MRNFLASMLTPLGAILSSMPECQPWHNLEILTKRHVKVRNPLHSTYWLSRLNRYENLLLVAVLILEIQKKNDSKISPFLPVPSGPSRCDMDRFKLPSVCFVAKCVTVQCGAKPVSVKGLYHEVSSLAIANLTVYPHTQHDSNKWRLKGQRCLSEKQHECMNCIGFFQDPSGGSLAFFWGEKPMSLLPTSKNEVVTGSKSVDIHIIDS